MQLVGRDELPNAIALNSSLFNTARIFGPALAGIVLATAGAGWCFAINSASFLAVLLGLLLMRPDELYKLAGRVRPTLVKGVREAVGYVRADRKMLVLTCMAVVVMSISFNVNVLLPVLAKNTLDAGPRTFGIVTSCFGAGALVGALVAATVAQSRWRFILSSVAVFGVAELLIAPLHSVILVGVLLFVCGVCFTTYTASSNSAVQLGTPDHLRGRVLGVFFYAWTAPLPLASPLIGWLCSVGGTELAFVFGGLCALAAAGIGALVVRRDAARARSARVERARAVTA
jgi:predicted MFS family arabinose efflux permease